ncbi:hypothetical protein FPOAC2_13009 [Fusarium poae]|uniref:hypothetical protein n=1 Tax=Fusarium poae TaxID=36050 RepID=UPI001CEAEA5B|nr:hypothetical protein FPOAC1_012650 [Fusarium poae]KAG8667811.1 hypothetical protein FPOAC1_012650 [Fusarium poae]
MHAMFKSLFQKTSLSNALLKVRKRVSRDLMKKVCLMFCDQQLITGASVLIVGYSKHCDITQYHFYIAANLGMACFATFQALLPICGSELHDELRKGWRMAWISAIFACVLALNFVIYNDYFLATKHFGLSMYCVWKELPGYFTPQLMPYVVIGTLFDVWSYLSIIMYLYPTIMETRPLAYLYSRWLSFMMLPTWFYLLVKDKKVSRKPEFLWHLLEAFVGLVFVIVFTIRELFGSLSVDLVRVFFYLIQSTNSVAWARRKAEINGRKGSEDTWGFGQILPMLLLALPTLAFIEALVHREATNTQELTGSTTPVLPNFKTLWNQSCQDRINEYEDSMYSKVLFKIWLCLVMLSLHVAIVFLAFRLPEGVPI